VQITTFGPIDDQRLRVEAALLTQILKEPAFNVLRTQEQLGYIVFCTGFSFPGDAQHALRVIVQSERSAAYCENRVEAFFDLMKTNIEEMTTEAFEEQKAGLEKKWREKVKNLKEETNQFFNYIASGHLDFLRGASKDFPHSCMNAEISAIGDQDADLLPSVSKEDVLKLFMSRVHQSSKARSKLSVHMLAQKEKPKPVSRAAVDAFEALVKESSLEADDQVVQQAKDKEFTLPTFVKYWATALGKSEASIALLKQIPELLKLHPAEGDPSNDIVDTSKMQFIEDPQAFRAGLSVALDPSPLALWSDLPHSRI